MDNLQAVRDFFKENGWEYGEQEGCFESGVSLDSEIEGAMLQIDSNNGGIVVLAGLDFDIPCESFAEVMELCNMLNMLLPTGAMFLDTAERILVCRLGQYYGEGNADANDVGEQVSFCLDMLEKAANCIQGLTDGELTPDEAAEMILRPADMEEE